MDRNIERAIAGAQADAAEKTAHFTRQREILQDSLKSPTPIHVAGKRISPSDLRDADNIIAEQQKTEANRAAILDSITDLSFTGTNSWDLRAAINGVDITIIKTERDGKPLAAVLIDGVRPQTEKGFEAFVRKYSNAVREVQEALREQEILEEIRAHKNQGKSQPEATPTNPQDHLGYFKELRIDLDALEGLSDEEIEALVNAAYRARARFAHPDKVTGPDDEKMKHLNKIKEVLGDTKTRMDYMNRRGTFDPRRR